MDAAEERGLLLQEDGYHELLLLPSLVFFLLKFASPFFPEMKLDILFLFFLGKDGMFASTAQLVLPWFRVWLTGVAGKDQRLLP
jgi:hypothetical protein